MVNNDAWNSTRTGFTYTNGDRTATASFTSFTDTVTKHVAADGKLYFEVAIGQAGAGSSFFYFADATTEPINIFDSGTVSDNSFGPIGTCSGFATGDTLAIAIDLTNLLVWIRTKHAGSFGNYNSSPTADPATGVGGIPFAAFTGSLAFGYNPSNTNDQATINTGDFVFAQTIPSAYSTWFGSVAGGFIPYNPWPQAAPILAQ